MKKKYLAVAALAAVLGISTACGSNKTPVDPKPDIPVEPAEKTGTVVIAPVENGTIKADKTSGKVGDTITLTITANDNYAVDYVKHGEKALEVKDGKATFELVEGENKITAAFKKVEAPKPETKLELVLTGEKEITVAAGTEVVLPTVKATDAKGTDVTDLVEIEDIFESGTIKEGKFKAFIAGEHEISYYVETEDGQSAEDFVTVTVTPAHEETFDVTGANDPALIAEYKTFKENFELGNDAPIAPSNSNGAIAVRGTEEAINGNSLIVDMNKTAGNAAYTLFINGFNNSFKRGLQTTYTISFKYKIIDVNDNFGDVYFGINYDGFSGLNNPLIKSDKAVKGETYEVKYTFPSVVIPETGNAWLQFFKLRGSDKPCEIALDDFVVEAKELEQIKSVEPTDEQLKSENGFTWDFNENKALISSGELVTVDTIADETIKTNIKASGLFGAKAYELINSDEHTFFGLTKNNLIAGDTLTVSLTYYAANKEGLVYRPAGSDNEIKHTTEDLGNGVFKDTFTTKILGSFSGIKIFANNNPEFHIYLAKVTAKTVAGTIADDETSNGHKLGEEFVLATRQWGNEVKPNNTIATKAFDDNAKAIENPLMGKTPTRVEVNTRGVHMEWCQMGHRFETGCTYEVTMTYFVESWDTTTKLIYKLDGSQYPEISTKEVSEYMAPGFHQETIEIVPTEDTDFFCFLANGEGNMETTGVFYLANITAKLTKIAK